MFLRSPDSYTANTSTVMRVNGISETSSRGVPLVVHVLDRLTVGGLENGLVNLINHMPQDRYRHAIVCIYDFDSFRQRIQTSDVQVVSLGKQPGHDLRVYSRL